MYPYLQNQADSTIVVRWETATLQPGLVQYGLTAGYGMLVTQPSPDSFHELTLTGLVADTVYHYRAISGADTSPAATFRSRALSDRPFRFFAYGDTRTDSAAHQGVIDQMLLTAPLPAFALQVGDLTENGTLPDYSTFFNVEGGLLAGVPMYPAAGNHDLRAPANWYRFFVLPNNEMWYTIRNGNSAFHALNTYDPFTPGSDQYDWLVRELRADSADPGVRHVFIWFHDPPYTTNAAHSSNLDVRAYLCPLFERYGVRLVFLGHVHAYEHSFVNGVHYIVTGGGGAPLAYNWNDPEPWTVFRQTCYEFTLVDVHGDSVFCRSIKPDGQVFDSFAVITPPSGIVAAPPTTASAAALLSISSSPFSRRVRFTITLQSQDAINLTVFDADGRRWVTLFDGSLPAGGHSFYWEPVDAPEGSYVARLRTSRCTGSARFTYSR